MPYAVSHLCFGVPLQVDSATRTLIVAAAVCFSTTHLVVALFAPKVAPRSVVLSYLRKSAARPTSMDATFKELQGKASASLTREQVVEMEGDAKNVLIGELQASKWCDGAIRCLSRVSLALDLNGHSTGLRARSLAPLGSGARRARRREAPRGGAARRAAAGGGRSK